MQDLHPAILKKSQLTDRNCKRINLVAEEEGLSCRDMCEKDKLSLQQWRSCVSRMNKCRVAGQVPAAALWQLVPCFASSGCVCRDPGSAQRVHTWDM